MRSETALALDLGGTKLLIGQVDEEGRVLRSKSYPSGSLNQKQAAELIEAALDDYLETVGLAEAAPEPERLGVGLIGLVQAEEGVWTMIDPGRRDPLPLADRLRKRFGFACRLENDVKAAALAERKLGAGRDSDDFIYLNVGTGIAAGFIAGGRLIRGWQNDAGEVGHMTVDYTGGIPCACGRFGCAEAIASGSGMDRRVRLLGQRYPGSPLIALADQGFVRAEALFAHAEAGDPLAARIATDAADAAAELIMNLARATNPERIVLGGGIAASRWMKRELPKRLGLPAMESVRKGVVFSPLDPAAASLIGAATVAFAAEF